MIRAFIAHIEVEPDANLEEVASRIKEDLGGIGYDVKRVVVWSSPQDLADLEDMNLTQPGGLGGV